MNRRQIILLFTCLISSILIVIALYVASDNIIYKHNTFYRIFPPHAVIQSKVLDLKYNSYYFAGATHDNIFLGNFTSPLHLLVIKPTLTDTQQIQLTVADTKYLAFKSSRIKIDSPFFYITDGQLPILLRGRINDWQAYRFMYDSAYFNDAIPINSSSLAIRAVSSETQERILGKVSASDSSYVKLVPGLLEKQIDGLFCTDGMLNYNKELAKLVYVYYYRNQYIVMDTNLNLSYRSNTIDTISRAKIKPAQIGQNAKTMAAPPLIVNRLSCVYKNWLFINSTLMSKNENEGAFDDSSVIDVYGLANHTYAFSFYLINQNENKVRHLQVFNDQLYAIYDHFLVSFELNTKFFGTNIMADLQ